MTKSRSARLPFLALAAAWPAPTLADPPANVTAEEALGAYDRWFDEVTGIGRARPGVRARCNRGAEDEEIVVCGRSGDEYRIPYVPEEGARTRTIASEAPSGAGALSVGDACCGTGGGINLIAIGGALLRGADRILHPD
jgi:hypothetical protein